MHNIGNSCMRVFHQNIAGLLGKLDLLEACIAEFNDIEEPIDVICITETFVKNGDEENVNFKNFKLAANFSRKQSKRGGVCILVKRNYNYRILDFLQPFSKEIEFECCGIELTEQKCIIICIYRTPNAEISVFFTKFDTLLHKLREKINKKIIIAGDFNINMLMLNSKSNRLRTTLKSYGFEMHITEKTRQHTCIDQIASNIQGAIGKVHKLGLSDHSGQTLSFLLKDTTKSPGHYYILRRQYTESNISNFINHLNSLSFLDVYEEDNIESAFTKFYDTFLLIYKLCFPINRVKVNNFDQKLKWPTTGKKISCRTKRALRYKYYKNKTQENKNKYTHYSNIHKKTILLAQKNCFTGTKKPLGT